MIRDAEHSSRMERYLYLVESKTIGRKSNEGSGNQLPQWTNGQ